MSSERELDEGIKSIKSAWRREHTARANLKRMLEQAEADNAKLRELVRYMHRCYVRGHDWGPFGAPEKAFVEQCMCELGIEVE